MPGSASARLSAAARTLRGSCNPSSGTGREALPAETSDVTVVDEFELEEEPEHGFEPGHASALVSDGYDDLVADGLAESDLADAWCQEPEETADGDAEPDLAEDWYDAAEDEVQQQEEDEDKELPPERPAEVAAEAAANVAVPQNAAPAARKRAASSGHQAAPIAKRPRLASDVSEPGASELAAELLTRWGLEDDPAAHYVLMKVADAEEAAAIGRTSWWPSKKGKTPAEQLNDEVLRVRESRMLPGNALDPLEAFAHTQKLSREDVETLRELVHKDLQYVMRKYTECSRLDDLLDEAASIEAPAVAMSAAAAAAHAPGALAMGRLLRLDLIEPACEAVVIGDANLSFSQLLLNHRNALGHTGGTLVTTFEQIETLRERYAEIDATVRQINASGGQVMHGVDGTRLRVDERFSSMLGSLGAVYYNFPHAGVVQGFFDGHPFVRWRHENLMTLFFGQLRSFMKPGGVVKVSSNSSARGVRYSDILRAASASGFVHLATFPFLEWALRDYRRSYGDRRDATNRPKNGANYRSQRAQADMVYCFEYQPSESSESAPPTAPIRYPPSKKALLEANEGNLGTNKERRVTEIYNLFLSYVGGIHVG